MNVGQVLEIHLGWIASQGWKVEGNPDWAKGLSEQLVKLVPVRTSRPRCSTVLAKRKLLVCWSQLRRPTMV